MLDNSTRWSLPHGNPLVPSPWQATSLAHAPDATPAWVIAQIESWRREHKWSAQRITDELKPSAARLRESVTNVEPSYI
jgi:hypothetical protein